MTDDTFSMLGLKSARDDTRQGPAEPLVPEPPGTKKKTRVQDRHIKASSFRFVGPISNYSFLPMAQVPDTSVPLCDR